MRFVFFCHSLISDWNNGNAHFLRGVVRELADRGHAVDVYEPRDGWSLTHLLATVGADALHAYSARYPGLWSHLYDPVTLQPERILEGADAVIVHEWNTPELVAAIGKAAAILGVPAFFHDTHHRVVTAPDEMARFDLSRYTGVLAFGRILAERYRALGLAPEAWVWHEAADTRLFTPIPGAPAEGDIVWIGNWGDEERSRELLEFLLQPAQWLRLRGRVHGVRYPLDAVRRIRSAGLEYRGWLANHTAPDVYARFRVTVHVPRQPYVHALPGIPTIRVFEALACGIPLVCAPWEDSEGLFDPGTDFLIARDGAAMRRHLADVLGDPGLARSLAESGRRRVLAAHTCAHRVDELLALLAGVGVHSLEEQIR